jgi:AcrR family transcriptional regulator
VDDRGYARGRAKRAQILDTAVTVFGKVGYRGASLREIAARCAISHPGLLHHFPTKEALLLAVLERRDETAEALTRAGAATASEELTRIVEVVADNATRPEIVELFATLSTEAAAGDHPAHEYFAGRYRRVVAQLTDAYQAASDEGALRAGIDPASAAHELIALMDGLQIQWLYEPAAVDMAAIVAAHLHHQLIGPPSPPSQQRRTTINERTS